MITSKANWYAIYTYPKMERKINSTLLRQDIKTYLPLQRVMRKWSDRVKEIHIPLFPNYLFVNISGKERTKVLSVTGVSKFISFDGHPTIISDDEVEIIRKLESSVLELESPFITGDRVQIIQGPFAGLKGILYKKKGKERFGVQLTGLRQALSLEICVSILKKI